MSEVPLHQDEVGVAGRESRLEMLDHRPVELARSAQVAALGRVETHYAKLFEEAPDLSGPGNLVFTGGEPEPGTLETLETRDLDSMRVRDRIAARPALRPGATS